MDAFEELYQHHKEEVYRYLLWLTDNRSLAEELTQETFLQVFLSFPSYRQESSIRTWIFSIARHQWLHFLRKKRPETEEWTAMADFFSSQQLEAETDRRELLEYIYRLLDQKKDPKTKNILLWRMQGYSYAEISSRLSISESSARVLDFRGKKWLKE